VGEWASGEEEGFPTVSGLSFGDLVADFGDLWRVKMLVRWFGRVLGV
jgi:hypothetical protein